MPGLCGVGLLGVWERDAVRGPNVFDPVVKGAVGRLGNIPSRPLPPPFSLFPVPFQKRDWMLDVDLSQCGSVHTKKKKEEEDGGSGRRRAGLIQ